MKRIAICLICNIKFSHWASSGKGKYCSRKCYYKSDIISNLKNAIHTKESRMKQSLAMMGHKPWNIGKRGIPCHSEKWKQYLRERFTGKNNPSKRPEVREKIRQARAKQVFPIKDSSIEVKIQNFLSELKIDYFAH